MMEDEKTTNYSLAKQTADLVDNAIIGVLQQGRSFRVEAGAGSGKTYSLNRVIEWIQANKWEEYRKKNQKVISITYTNAAVEVIKERISNDSFIVPSTIHSFAWTAIKQYQSFLINYIENNLQFNCEESDFTKITAVSYTLGHRYKDQGTMYLYHDDVIALFCELLENAKYRRIFTDKYPLILIDEYQDTNKQVIELFLKYFISNNSGPQFGFFGDSWQTIYQSNKAHGLIEHPNIEVIKKGSNFRSASSIVDVLNKIRPELPQKSAIDSDDGKVIVITSEDYKGIRRTDRTFKDDLPVEEIKKRVDTIISVIDKEKKAGETTKVLMLTHKVLAAQQGYGKLLSVLNDGLRDKEDIFLLFFMNIVEPVYKALKDSNMNMLFDTLKVMKYPVSVKGEKNKWKRLFDNLEKERNKRAIDVLECVIESQLIPPIPNLIQWYLLYIKAPETKYSGDTSIKEYLEIDYKQFISAIDFLYPTSIFSTDHGVKGEEYDNVVFVISKGWNQYQFEVYAPMITGQAEIPIDKKESYERNRNLFYVCCSRARKQLILFLSVPISTVFKSFLIDLVGEHNIFTYNQYLEMKSVDTI